MEKAGRAASHRAPCMVALLLAWPVAATESAEGIVDPPDPEFLEFLGETSGVGPELVAFMESPEAKRALKDAARKAPEKSDAVNSSDVPPTGAERFMAVGAERWQTMTDTDRAAARARFNTWRALPPSERERLRELWTQFRELTPDQKEALHAAYRKFLELPPERRDALSDRWQQMSPEERRRAIQRRQGPKPDTADKRPCPPC